MSDQIEMWWKCSHCHTLNGGLSKKCGERVIVNSKVTLTAQSGCGKRIEKEEWIYPDNYSSSAAITDTGQLEQALAGPDWLCAFCGSSQRRLDGRCANCAGGQSDSHEDRDEPEDNIFSKTKPDSSPNFVISRPKLPKINFEKETVNKGLWAIGISSGLIALIWITIWLFSPRYVTATVQDMEWISTVNIERYQEIHEEGWSPAFDATNVSSVGSRIHHYDHVHVSDRVETYTETYNCGQNCVAVPRVCTTIPRSCTTTPRSCTSNRNGTMSCSGGGTYCTGGGQSCSGGGQSCSPKYCTRPATRTIPIFEDQPRYQMWYGWNVWRWMHNRSVVRSGHDANPKLPSQSKIGLNNGLFGLQKERSSIKWKYTTRFVNGDEVFNYYPETNAEFVKLNIGTSKTLKVMVTGVSIEK